MRFGQHSRQQAFLAAEERPPGKLEMNQEYGYDQSQSTDSASNRKTWLCT